MDVREKLLEHINYFTEHVPHEEGQTWEEAFADHLIANGVTFAKDTDVPSKWIPVTERLPETTCRNLAMTKYGFQVLAYFTGKEWRHSPSLSVIDVTHWMPMPEPPKEGE